jgi:CheY-like chemotaxis protein
MNTLRVLVVDNEPKNREILIDFFRYFGDEVKFDLDEAKTGLEATKKATDSHYDLVIMDINMETPYAGLEAARTIKERDAGTIIWALTGQNIREYRGAKGSKEIGAQAGCDRYIQKPFSQVDLLRSVSETLNVPIPERVRQILEDYM